jgi:hypothetical protein
LVTRSLEQWPNPIHRPQPRLHHVAQRPCTPRGPNPSSLISCSFPSSLTSCLLFAVCCLLFAVWGSTPCSCFVFAISRPTRTLACLDLARSTRTLACLDLAHPWLGQLCLCACMRVGMCVSPSAQDPKTLKWVEAYARNSPLFFKDFAAAYSKLLALGT